MRDLVAALCILAATGALVYARVIFCPALVAGPAPAIRPNNVTCAAAPECPKSAGEAAKPRRRTKAGREILVSTPARTIFEPFDLIVHAHYGGNDYMRDVFLGGQPFEEDIQRMFAAVTKDIRPEPHLFVLDVGANVGFFSGIAMRNGFRTVSYEAMPQNYAALVLMAMLNHFGPLSVAFNRALGESVGPEYCVVHSLDNPTNGVMVPRDKLSEHQRIRETYGDDPDPDDICAAFVSTTTLDQQVLEVASHFPVKNESPSRCVFMKIDCEGFEMAVLRGAREFIARFEPCAIVPEINPIFDKPMGWDSDTIQRFMDSLGYAPAELRKDGTLHSKPFRDPRRYGQDIDVLFVPRVLPYQCRLGLSGQ